MLDIVADQLKFPRTGLAAYLAVYEEAEQDIHLIDRILDDDELVKNAIDSVRGGASGMFNPRVYRRVPNMGTVWDYRHFTAANGPNIKPLVAVEHIPVIRQMSGRVDLDVLWRVLVSQGLMVHNATDGEGNVALYVNNDRLCFHARGANSVSCGTEHMHLTTLEAWSSQQLNAAAWLWQRMFANQGLSRRHGNLDRGDGFVKVRRRGHVTHEAVSEKAGFHDRSDPGEKMEALWGEITDRAVHFGRHGKF